MSDIPARPVLPGEDTKSVSLREFEQRLEKLEQQFATDLKHEREMREEITARHEEARKLNASEIARRLEELNHAHKMAAENWARSLPREMFDQWKQEYDKRMLDIGTMLTTIAPHSSQIGGLMSKMDTVEKEVNTLKTVGSSHAQALDVRVDALESLVSRFRGAGWLLGFAGLAGVLALFLGLMRLAGVVQ